MQRKSDTLIQAKRKPNFSPNPIIRVVNTCRVKGVFCHHHRHDVGSSDLFFKCHREVVSRDVKVDEYLTIKAFPKFFGNAMRKIRILATITNEQFSHMPLNAGLIKLAYTDSS